MENEIKIGHVLKHLMKARKLTYKKLSAASGVPESTIKSWGANVEPKSLIPARKVARVLGVPVEYLIFGATDAPKADLASLLTTQLFSGWCKVTIEMPVTTPIAKAMKAEHDE